MADERTPDPRVGQYVITPEHLYGARVAVVHEEPAWNGGTWFALDREHPTEEGRIAVGADYVTLSPVLIAPLSGGVQ